MDHIEYNTDKVIAIANKVIKVYGWNNKKDVCTIARMVKEKSDINGEPLPYEWNGQILDYNRAYSTAERVIDYYKNFEMTDTDYQIVAKIKDGFKKHLFQLIHGKDVPSYISLTMKLLNYKTIEAEYVGLVASWPHTVNKKKEVVNA